MMSVAILNIIIKTITCIIYKIEDKNDAALSERTTS